MVLPRPSAFRLGASVVLACGAFMAGGCTLEPFEPSVGRDAGRVDAGRFDAGEADAGRGDASADAGGGGGLDAGPRDGGPRDADAGPPDTGPPDAGPPDGGSAPSCDDLYGGIADYMLCQETSTSCEMYVTLSGASCSAACAMAGGTCLDSFDEGPTPATRCAHESNRRSCGAPSNNSICVCTRGVP